MYSMLVLTAPAMRTPPSPAVKLRYPLKVILSKRRMVPSISAAT
jgi:hypothetical protein